MSNRAPAQRTFALDEGDLCWWEWGVPAAEKPSLLLLHATGFHGRIWDQIIARLPADWHIVAPDVRGHGRSFKPDDLRNWGIVAQDIGVLVAAHGWQFDLAAGHSMGAVCVSWLAAHQPDAVARALLIDPVIFAPPMYEMMKGMAVMPVDSHPVARRRSQFASAQAMAERLKDRFPYNAWDAATMADYVTHGLLPADDGFQLACPPNLEASMYLGNAGAIPLDWLAAVQCPVTVLRGRNGERAGLGDFSISPTWPELAGAFPDGRDMQWDNCSHFIPMEAPDRLAALMVAEVEHASA